MYDTFSVCFNVSYHRTYKLCRFGSCRAPCGSNILFFLSVYDTCCFLKRICSHAHIPILHYHLQKRRPIQPYTKSGFFMARPSIAAISCLETYLPQPKINRQYRLRCRLQSLRQHNGNTTNLPATSLKLHLWLSVEIPNALTSIFINSSRVT